MNRFVFAVQDSVGATSLYSTDGTAAGTTDLGMSRFAYLSDEAPIDFVSFKGGVAFLGYSNDGGSVYGGVGFTDGTTGGTSFEDVNGPDVPFIPTTLGVVGNTLLMAGGIPAGNGGGVNPQIWASTDGVTYSTISDQVGVGQTGIVQSGEVGYFAATDNYAATLGLWRTDGTATGTYPVTAGDISFDPGAIISLGNGRAAFTNENADGSYTMWTTDGSAYGTAPVYSPSLGNILSGGAAVNGRIVFSALDTSGNVAAWSSDGTTQGTVELLVNGPDGGPVRIPGNYVHLGKKVLFDSGSGLVATDGTKAGTTVLGSVATESLTVSGNKAFFFSPQADIGAIFATDGTKSGTVKIKIPGLQSFDGNMTAVGSQVVFEGTDTSGNEAFFSSDGTVRGTKELNLPVGVAVQPGAEIGALPVPPASSGPGIVTLGGGNQVYTASSGDTVVAGTGHDTVIATAGNVTVTGSSGTLTFFGGSASSSVFGGNGSSVLFGGSGGGNFVGGTAGHNVLVSQGASGDNTTLTGGGAGDQIFGSNTAADVLTAGAGRESIVGGGGPTTINGGSAADVIFAGAGPTSVYGGTGAADTIVGGSGTLSVSAQNGDAVFGGSGAISVMGSESGADSIVGGAGALSFTGSGANMLVVAGSGASQIRTENGASLIFGEAGQSTVIGGAGSMTVVLGSGTSNVSEGSGQTTYDVIKGAAGSVDVLNGYKVGTDKIDLFGYAPSDINVAVSGGNTMLSLSDGTKIQIVGVTDIGRSLLG